MYDLAEKNNADLVVTGFLMEYYQNGKEVKYPLPDLGKSKFERIGKVRCKNIKSLRISDMNMKEENNFFIVDINLYHNKVKLQNKYGVHISVPINFT